MEVLDLPPPAGRAVDEHAVTFLHAVIREREGRADARADGPLTNVARLLATAPDARPERIVLMGGSVGEGNRTPAAEFNVWCDPEAARRVFESGIDVTMIGLDVTHKALVNEADADVLRGVGRVGKVAAELLDFYRIFHRRQYPDLDGPAIDPSPSRTDRPGLVEAKPAYIEVDWLGAGRSRVNVDRNRFDGHDPTPPSASASTAAPS
jgi:inosine-uridine nucleoside N-ribohydrolase